MGAISVTLISSKIDKVYEKRHIEEPTKKISWWMKPFVLSYVFVMSFLFLKQARGIIKELDKLFSQLTYFDKSTFELLYNRLNMMRDQHLKFGKLTESFWLLKIFHGWNERIIADIEDLMENIYFGLDNEFRELVSSIASKI